MVAKFRDKIIKELPETDLCFLWVSIGKGDTTTNATSRAEALQAYIKNQNAKGKNLVGGIIIKDDKKKWRVNQ